MDTFASDLEQGIATMNHDSHIQTGPPAVDLSHHLSKLANRRKPSPLKDIMQYMLDPNMISMAGGLPAPAYFPFDSISANALVSDSFNITDPTVVNPAPHASGNSSDGPLSWFWKLFGSSSDSPVHTKELVIPKYAANPADPAAIQLSTSLQYSMATGILPLQKFITSFTKNVFKPANPDTQILVHTGNTDGWFKAVATLCNAGEVVITELWTYPSALAAAWPLGVDAVGVGMDGQGMRPDLLEELLEGWNVEERGGKARPHVMYTVPIGQNPCGTTMGAERKKAIYDICVKYDVIIVEDDPYYFLQVGEYVLPRDRRHSKPSLDTTSIAAYEKGGNEEQAFLDSLAPSYLRFDWQGRVIRLDTFSKTIAPGSRLGWFTCSPLFAERLLRQAETSTQAPCGFGQSLISQLLVHEWKYSGYIRWLRGIRVQYKARRDALVDTLIKAFDVEETWAEGDDVAPLKGPVKIYVARSKHEKTSSSWCAEKESKGKVLFTFVSASAGMFIWLKIHLYNHHDYVPNLPPTTSPVGTLEYKLFQELAEAKVLFAPGWMFGTTDDDLLMSPEDGSLIDIEENKQVDVASEHGKYGHYRISFSNATEKEFSSAIATFAKILKKNFD